jgi:dihydroorotate dehydrogenase electron transfer subunit
MPAPPDDARALLARTLEVRPLGGGAILLRVEPEVPLPPVRASRFFMLKRLDRLAPLIPRPYSLYRQSEGVLEFLIKLLGRGSQALAALRPGENLRLVGPLGNGWPTLDGEGPPWVMLAGGVGSAPFPLAIEQALAGMDGAAPCPAEKLHLLFGAACADQLVDLDAFQATGIAVHTATMDGSHGQRGHVLGLLGDLQARGVLPEEVRLLACGPEPMLHAVEAHAQARGLEAWLSLETLMGCGVGICNGCPVPTRPEGPLGSWPNAKCCVEGPVFSTRAIAL